MNDEITKSIPTEYQNIAAATSASKFTMGSDPKTCSLLRTLAASRRSGRLLELGTGTGLATAWILDGMDNASTLVSVDNDPACIDIARMSLGQDPRLELILSDGEEWILKNRYKKFDFIFADTWHGKYLLTDEALNMLTSGGMYIIDDMIPQPNWPEGHQAKVDNLLAYLDSRTDLVLTRQLWASGLVIAVKK
jgi:predicted O-methyltransferase YrrM